MAVTQNVDAVGGGVWVGLVGGWVVSAKSSEDCIEHEHKNTVEDFQIGL